MYLWTQRPDLRQYRYIVNHKPSDPVVAAVVLAAGTSSRFGDTKLVAPFRGKPLLQHALIAARDACNGPTSLVVGHDQGAIVVAASELNDRTVVNPNYLDGIGTSIAAGVGACSDTADAILIVLADQPLITTDYLRKVIAAWSGSPNEIVASAYSEVLGPPVLFSRDAFDQLQSLTGDQGAKQLLSNSDYSVKSLACPEASYDIDIPEDLNTLQVD